MYFPTISGSITYNIKPVLYYLILFIKIKFNSSKTLLMVS